MTKKLRDEERNEDCEPEERGGPDVGPDLLREIMGATDPAKAAPGTIRKDWGNDVEQNAVHGSDGAETAANEIAFFFRPDEIF